MSLEYRSVELTNLSVNKEKRTIVGKAVVYNSMSKPLKTASGTEFREVILPGALRSSLENNDILAFKEHNPAMLLGRKSAGTLRLSDTDEALEVEIDVPDTSYGNDLLVSAARGDIKGFSFGFNSPKTRNYTRDGAKIREISALDLKEVSVVSHPAYSATSLSLRDADFVEETKSEEKPQIPQHVHKDYELKFKFLSIAEAQPRASN